MENTYLIKVDEDLMKKILSLSFKELDVIELESIDDLIRFNLLLKAMKIFTPHELCNLMDLHINTIAGFYTSPSINMSGIFSGNKSRYYSAKELISILVGLQQKVNGRELTASSIMARISKTLDIILLENKQQKK